MKSSLAWAFSFLGLIPYMLYAEISIDKLRGEAYTEVGSVVKGSFGGEPFGNQYLSRLAAKITASDTINGRLRITVGVGGIFYQALPLGDFWKKSLKFAPGITEASSELIITPNLGLEQGYFPLKYNPASMNLGEYLLRSEAYPTYLTTGGWTMVESANTKVLGMRLLASHFNGAFKHEAGIYLELKNAPFFDVTPAYLFSWRPRKGIEIGGGVAFRRFFSPKIGYTDTSFKDEAVSAAEYVTIANFPEVQNQANVYYTYEDGSGKRVGSHGFAVWNSGSRLDTAKLFAGKTNASVTQVQMIQDGSRAGSRTGIKKFLQNLAGCSEDSVKCTNYMNASSQLTEVDTMGLATGAAYKEQVTRTVDITRKAINVMAHANFDFTEIFGWEKRFGTFEMYGEWAVLGVQNQPVYYQNILHRMPVTVGVHLPTFGLLELLALETEYLANPYQDSYRQLAGQSYKSLAGSNQAIPDMDYSQRKFTLPSVHADDWKWSVYGVRTIVPGLKLKVQVANDHVRLQYFDIDALAGAYFGATSSKPQTTRLNQWYCVAHLQWGF